MKSSHKKRLILGAIFVGFILFLRYLGVGKYITFDIVRSNRIWLQHLISKNYWTFVLGYLGVYIFVTSLSLPLSVLLSAAGGFFFGTLRGALYANIGATIGATISFILIRDLFGKVFQERYKDRLIAFNCEFKKYGYSYLLLLHVVMVIPLFIPNILAGLAHVSLWTFIWTTSVGLIPGTFTFAFAGQQFMTINSIREIFSIRVIIFAFLLLLLSLTPFFVRWYRAVRKKKGSSLEV